MREAYQQELDAVERALAEERSQLLATQRKEVQGGLGVATAGRSGQGYW